MIGRNQIRYIKSGTVPRTGTPLEGEWSICIGGGGGSYRFGRTRWSVACWLSAFGRSPVPTIIRGQDWKRGTEGDRGGGGWSRENDEGERGRLPDVVRVYDKLMVFRGGQPSSSTFGGRSHAKIQIVRPTVPLIIYGPSSLSLSLPPLFFQYVNIETAPTRPNTFLIERIEDPRILISTKFHLSFHYSFVDSTLVIFFQWKKMIYLDRDK